MQSAEKIFFSLEGKWGLTRSTNGFGKMKGDALFSLIPDTMPSFSYREEGIYETPYGEDLLFYRDYIYVLYDGKIEIYFASHQKKQHLFHTLTFAPSRKECAVSVHLCGKDLYTPTYVFLDEDTFTLEYKVKGPKKDLVIQTYFQRRAN